MNLNQLSVAAGTDLKWLLNSSAILGRPLRLTPENARWWDLMVKQQSRWNVGFCYCSVFDECWGESSETADSRPVKQCTRDEIATVIREGTGRMPGFPDMGGRNISDLVDFLLTGKDKGADPTVTSDPSWLKYRIDGETLFRDPDGYPPITPPWGTLNAIDLNAGTIKWQIPFGEYPELAAQGMKNTGSDNYGGPVVTAGTPGAGADGRLST